MEINHKAIKLKLDRYLEQKEMTNTAFAEELDMSRQAFQNMISGRQKFTSNFFVGIIRKFPDISLRELFDDDPMNTSIVAEDPAMYQNGGRAKELEKALREIKKICIQSQI